MTQWGLDTIFNPAKRHMDEEKRRLQSTREEVGDNSGGKRIDLESGKVRIAAGSDEAEAEDGAPVEDAASKERASKGGGGPRKDGDLSKDGGPRKDGVGKKPTAAQVRAAARRGRTLD